LIATIAAGKSVFKSDSMSTISIIKEIIIKETQLKKLQVDITNSINEESIRWTLNLIHPKIN